MSSMTKRTQSNMHINRVFNLRSILSGLFITIGFLTQVLMAQDVAAGKALFEQHCTSCHAIDQKLIGPALKNAHTKYDEAWLISWIRNSADMIAKGDPKAIKIYEEFNKLAMNSFDYLSDAEIKNIIAYIGDASNAAPAQATTTSEPAQTGSIATNNAAADTKDSGNANVLLAILILVLAVMIFVIARLNKALKNIISSKNPEYNQITESKTSWAKDKLMPWIKGLNPTIATLVVLTGVMGVFGAWFFNYANSEIGVQQAYAPTQPINFSHELHAGQYKIDCQYCHSTAAKSKQASVPPVNTCMNCHAYIDASAKYNGKVSPEIQKIRTAYEKNEPIKWVRIHNLADLAYFNHAQHVSIGKVECQACHGPIETMEKVYQHSSLQMGWCINCHRESEVDVANNDYYLKLHEDLKKQGKITTTVANNGGLECSKCHY